MENLTSKQEDYLLEEAREKHYDTKEPCNYFEPSKFLGELICKNCLHNKRDHENGGAICKCMFPYQICEDDCPRCKKGLTEEELK